MNQQKSTKSTENSTHNIIIHNNKNAIFVQTFSKSIWIYRFNMIPVKIPVSIVAAIDHLKMETQEKQDSQNQFLWKEQSNYNI